MIDAAQDGSAGPLSPEDAEIDRLVIKGLSAPLTPSEALRLDALVGVSPERAARAERLTRTWVLSGLLDKDGSGQAQATRRGVLAAGVGVVAVAASAALWIGVRPQVRLYRAPADGPLKATLADGTLIVLSRGGLMEARLDGRRRDVRLLAGEAYYAVAKDSARPFRIAVGSHALTVLGTRFNVDPGPDGLKVDLLEGSLKIEQATGDPKTVVLKPGQRFWEGHQPLVTAADVEAAAAWTDGRLVFDDATLSEIANDIRRHTGKTLSFSDRRLATLRFSGVLRLDDAEDWKPGLEAVLPIQMATAKDGYRVRPRP